MSRRGGSKRPRRGRHEPNRSATRLHAVPSPAGSPGPGSDPGAGPGPGHGSDTVPDDLLLREIREALRSDDPTAVATIVSSLLSVTSEWASGPALTIADLIAADRFDDDPFDDDPFDEDGDTPAPIPLAMLLESFIGVPFAETTAALTAMEPMLIDELEAAKVRRALATRRHPMPEHVKGVRDIAVTRAGHVGDELGDGDNVVLGLAWPGTRGVTAVIYVDEAFGTRVKDVFIVAEPFDLVIERYGQLIAEQGRRPSDVTEIDLADARASLHRAITLGEAPDAQAVPDDWSGPNDEPLGWPAARPFVELLLRRMPEGGSSVLSSTTFPELSAADAVAQFLSSPEYAALRGPHTREAAELIAADAERWAGHPLRLSPLQVELALSQRLPWAPGSSEALDVIEDVLPAYVRFVHARLGIPVYATMETLDAVDEWIDDFYDARTDAFDGLDDEFLSALAAAQRGDLGPLMRQSLASRVGGSAELDRLDAEPLPAEPLDLDTVPPDIRDTVTAVSDAIDQWLDTSPAVEHLGDLREEWRTACRRFLTGAASRDPGCLRRRASVEGRAGGVLWATGRANNLVGHSGAIPAQDLASDFGIKGSPSSKVSTMARAYTGGRWDVDGNLADARLLISTVRAEYVIQRDQP